ncbi:MAG: hypothetical protein GF311_01595 [Candidatus Lokiarchaeota archaeon]|jgi:hypothetical protein|nr:hypothetical protein [Candidatus Lokiarchaeota archaeon]
MSQEWQTTKERLYDYLVDVEGEFDLKELMKELEYTNTQALIEDFNIISHNLKRNGKKISVYPPRCMNCAYVVSLNSGALRIPSKCPNCHEQRFTMPMIKIEDH